MQDVESYKDLKRDKIGNLTCVLADLGALDDNLQVNMNFYKRDIWENVSEGI